MQQFLFDTLGKLLEFAAVGPEVDRQTADAVLRITLHALLLRDRGEGTRHTMAFLEQHWPEDPNVVQTIVAVWMRAGVPLESWVLPRVDRERVLPHLPPEALLRWHRAYPSVDGWRAIAVRQAGEPGPSPVSTSSFGARSAEALLSLHEAIEHEGEGVVRLVLASWLVELAAAA